MKTIVFTNDVPYNYSATYPSYSRIYGPAFKRLSSTSPFQAFSNSYTSRYSLTKLYLQPPPYDTMCLEDALPRSSCLENCMIRRFKELGRTPPMEILKEPSNLTHFSSRDYRDQFMRSKTFKLNEVCESECRRQTCNSGYSITYTQGFLDKDLGNTLRFHLATPSAPMTVIRALIKLDITEFLTYLSSCFGIWFGVSVFSLNPMNIKFKEKKSMQTRRPNHGNKWPNSLP